MKREIKAALLVCFLFAVSSCKKDDDTNTITVSESDVAEAVGESVYNSSGGLVVQSTTAAEYSSALMNTRKSAKVSDQCGIKHDTTLAATGENYSYSFNWNWLLTCSEIVPQTFVFNYAGKTAYETVRMSSSDSAKANITVSGLGEDSTYYVFNQTYTRNGSQTSKVNQKRSFTSLISIVSTDIRISKSTLKILSGTGAVTVKGEASGGKSFSYTGTITFLGNEKATLVVTGGATYNLTW